MTNEQLVILKKYIKFSAIIESLPVNIDNWREKLAGQSSSGRSRSFNESELAIIESALLAIAHTIQQNINITERQMVHSWQSITGGEEKCSICGVRRHKQFLMKYWVYYKDGVVLQFKPNCIQKKIINHETDEKLG